MEGIADIFHVDILDIILKSWYLGRENGKDAKREVCPGNHQGKIQHKKRYVTPKTMFSNTNTQSTQRHLHQLEKKANISKITIFSKRKTVGGIYYPQGLDRSSSSGHAVPNNSGPLLTHEEQWQVWHTPQNAQCKGAQK